MVASASEPQQSLDAKLAAVAALFGVTGRLVALTLAGDDGTELVIRRPQTTPGAELTPGMARILDALKASPVPLNRKQVAGTLGLKSTGGAFATDFGSLVESGLVHARAGEYADDASKFVDMT